MNQVQLLKNRFEKLNNDVESLDMSTAIEKAPLRLRRPQFKRSATCIDFSKLKINEVPKKVDSPPIFQRQLSNSSNSSYKSIKRSPAFRADAQKRPSVIKSVTKADPVKKKQEVDELEYLCTSATIKKALLKPLPTGSPPQKPPRVFLSPQFAKKENSSEKVQNRIQKLKISPNTLQTKATKATKTEDRKQIGGGLLNCIIAPCSIDPIYYEQIRKEKKIKDSEETIYMEPYAHLKKDFVNNNQKDSSSKHNEELHYMCTVLDPQSPELNGNTSTEDRRSSLETSSDLENYEKVSSKPNHQLICFCSSVNSQCLLKP